MLCNRLKVLVCVVFAGFMLTACGGGSGANDASSAIACAAPQPLDFAQPRVTGPRIGGVIEIEANARIDKDTAELIEEFEQPVLARVERIPSAVILGGYVSAANGTYESQPGQAAAFRYPADPRDRYCIDLQPGQKVNLEFFGPVVSNQVRLLNARDGAVIDTASFELEDERAKQVGLPIDASPGTYVIDIAAKGPSGPGRYVLSSSPAGGGQNLEWPSADFIPGEAVVTLAPTQSAAAQSSLTFEAQFTLARPLGNDQHKAVMPVTLMSQSQAQSLAEQKDRTLAWVRQLRQRPDVISASPNYIFRSLAAAPAYEAIGEPLFNEQWHYPLINLPQAWQLAPGGGEGVQVAVLDTGLFRYENAWHNDLMPNLPACTETTCRDFIDDDIFPQDPGSAIGGSVYHGTHVAGTVAASGGNGVGGTGVAPNATLFPVRVLDENGSGSLDDIVEAINWSVAAGADVINLSLGSSGYPASLAVAVDNAAAAGVLTVAAAGNSPNEQLVYPAALRNVFGVGAVDGAGVLASYSSTGSSDLAAPGGDAGRDANQDGSADVVISASGDDSPSTGGFTYAGLQGTSMATPHVSGVFALMKQLKPDLDTATLMALLGEITTGPAGPGYGAGLIDAARAVQAVSSGTLTLLSAEPSLLEFKDASVQETLKLDKVGDTDQSVKLAEVSVDGSAPWLSVGTPVPSEEGFAVPVSVDRSQLEQGRVHRAELQVVYQSGGAERTLEVPVVVAVESPVNAREAGLHFVLLVDEENETFAQTTLTSTDGIYRFAFGVVESPNDITGLNQVVAGESYYLIAGTDLDNNGLICAAGEACAEYPVAGLREKIKVVLGPDGRASVLDEAGQPIAPDRLTMTTSFSRPLSAQSLPRPGFNGYKLLESAHQFVPRAIAE